MLGQPDERDLAEWRTADPEALRAGLDDALDDALGTAPESEASDAELIAAVRDGAVGAYGQLYARHVNAARALARQLSRSPVEADDLVSEAFAKVLVVLRAGRGPDAAFRPYLLTALRHTAYDRLRQERKVELAGDVAAVSGVDRVAAEPFHDTAVAELERSLAARAFASLPERWRAVLWHTEVEGQSHAEVAPLFGLSANGVSAMAYRAREGLRKAYLQAHVERHPGGRCRAAAPRLGAWLRRGLSVRETAQVEAHLDECGDCRALAAELADVGGALRGVVAPLVLGAGTAGYLATVGAGQAEAAAAAAALGGAAAGGVAGASTASSTAQWVVTSAAAVAVAVVVVATGVTGAQLAVVPAQAGAPTTPTATVPVSGPVSPTPTPTPPGTTSSGVAPTSSAPPGSAVPTPGTTTTPGTTATGTTAAAPDGPAELTPVVPADFATDTGGPPTELPVTVGNTGRTELPAPVLTLSLPEGVQVVGAGNSFAGGRRAGLDGARPTVGCPAARGAVTCTADRGLAPGESVTFVLRLLAGPHAVSGVITGTVSAGSAVAEPVRVPVTVRPR